MKTLLLVLVLGCGDKEEDEAFTGGGGGSAADDTATGGGEGAGDDGGASAIAPDDYAAAHAEALCSWAQQCQLLAGFGGTYAQCVELVRGTTEQLISAPECGFSPQAAAQCLDALATQTCDPQDTPQVCDVVCSGG